jgi:hypothetical protein
MGRRALVPLVLVAVLLPHPARAVEAPRPLRTLTFDCTVSVADRRETPGDSRSSHVVMMGRTSTGIVETTPTGSGETTSSTAQDVKGSISVAVLSATDDAGLIVEVAENADQRTQPKVKIALGPDGTLFYDPANGGNLTEEEVALVRWLARGFYGDHPREPGTAWTVDQSTNGHVDVEHYRVLSRDHDRVTLNYALEEKAGGATGYDASREGSLVYDTALVVPVKATFMSSARRQIGATLSTTRSTITLTLTADSFSSLRS